MSALQFPCTIYQTQHGFNDYSSDDMRYGDLTEKQLRQEFGLDDVSDVVNPWTGEEVSLFSAFINSRPKSKTETAKLLFEEFLRLSMPAYYFGQRQLFTDLVKHFYSGRGNAFSSPFLDRAYREQILNDKSEKSSSLLAIKNTIRDGIDWDSGIFSESADNNFNKNIRGTVLPKFSRWIDYFNGLGMSVHDVYATKIQIISIDIYEHDFTATIKYSGQDHFGLDRSDIMNNKFHFLRAFRIWFVLQRWKGFGFKPFFTNINAVVTVKGRK
ncbi:DUF3289 family protein [Erwinia pyrifoliae]|uniref:DUF3289 family protein n=1 Tax=Erwinia pyrifoliae TaxID=79967 RepID=D0UJ18_ERWPY|nr:DUF3289 family protein [Erwinia pyrifoliae]ACY01327.1 unknown [Erwinia pyrifoliae]AUX71564.1 DUF3289 domain-containing protein [Erwinia pyrifoliae]MCA8878214.1 DUF3289 family protein [Erwinia pyrifoliae]MCT2386050.1 DUF3289 family protein [Erwinia pyrifoliae]MCU8588364.1 DUF3289 family protein [Erwinia pyrifoliae]